MQIFKPWLKRKFKSGTEFWMDTDYVMNHLENHGTYIRKEITRIEKYPRKTGRSEWWIRKITGIKLSISKITLKDLRKRINVHELRKTPGIILALYPNQELFILSNGRHRIVAFKILGLRKIKVDLGYTDRIVSSKGVKYYP
jgi:hypothetical protein